MSPITPHDPNSVDEMVRYLMRQLEDERNDMYAQLDKLRDRYIAKPEMAEAWSIEDDYARAMFTVRTYHIRRELETIRRHQLDVIKPAPPFSAEDSAHV